MKLRKIIFWTHLLAGIITGIFIALMSATGIAIAFEHEITDWLDRGVNQVSVPDDPTTKLTFSEQLLEVQEQAPDFHARLALLPTAPQSASTFIEGHHSLRYVDPYTGAISNTTSPGIRSFLHLMEDLHIHLAMDGDWEAFGSQLNGISNVALIVLCVTGLYLWFPKRWAAKVLKSILWFKASAKGKARDFNWHNVFGFWALIPLLILSVTAATFSYHWAHSLLFKLYGEEAPAARDGRMLASKPIVLTAPDDGALLPIDQILETVRAAYPQAEAFGVTIGSVPKGPIETGTSIKPIQLVAFEPAVYSTRGRIQLQVDPWTGQIIDRLGFEDRSAGLQARIWFRFLHTGEAFGLPGKIIAALGSFAGIILVYTGFSLSWRRFFKPKRKRS